MSRGVKTAFGVVLLIALSVGAVGSIGGLAASPVESQVHSDAPAVQNQENETNASVQYPPGVTADGVTNVTALVDAHRDALAETGYEFTFYENSSYSFVGNDSVVWYETTVGTTPASETLSEDRTTVEGETTVETTVGDETTTAVGTVGGNDSDAFDSFWFNDSTTEIVETGTVAKGLAPSLVVTEGSFGYDGYREDYYSESWANDSAVLSRTEMPNQLLLHRIHLSGDAEDDPFAVTRDDLNATLTKADIVNYTLQTGRFEVAEIEETENRTLFTLRAVEYNGSNVTYVGSENVSTYNATVVVDERGRVHRLALDFVGTEYERVSMHYEFELTRVGPVNVTRPPWTEKL